MATAAGESLEVLVVGAGPAGLAAALELNRLGRSVRIVDRNAGRTDLSKALAVNAKTLELLEPSGLAGRMVAAGIEIHGAALFFEGEKLVTMRFQGRDLPRDYLLGLPQDETERLFEETLAERGVSVERATELVSFEDDGAGVTARLKTPSGEAEVRAAWLLGADGARSTVREALGLDFAGKRYEEHWSLADVTLDWPTAAENINLYMHRDGHADFFARIKGDRWRLVSTAPGVVGRLPAGARLIAEHWQSDFQVALRQVESYRKGRCCLAGDAAHVHSPAGGRGMNLGIWDSVSFARRLAAGTLDGYDAERRPIGRKVLDFTDRLFGMTRLKSPLAQAMRNFVLRHLAPLPAAQRRFSRNLLGLAEE
ncbi:MAG: FAD-dependent monooxygenase [Tistlia sp.]|uniref:FAD-dependent monooxygenase n=1 Tax=Tistlia sp. TaxID=3057121 RepID=UPI0034A3C623